MSIKTRTSLLSLTVIAVLIFSAIGSTIAYADGGGCDSRGCDPTQGVPDAGGSESRPAESAASAKPGLLSEVPANTTVTVLDAAGQPLSLATQEAASAIATTSDPIWCPAGAPPIPGTGGCTPSFSSFDLLLTFLSGNAAFGGAGTIYVEQGAYTGGESIIDFNAYNLSNISSSALTVQGGWNGTNAVDFTTTSNFTIPIIIGASPTTGNPWGGSLTINNFVITNASTTGLTLFSQTDISLSQVESSNSTNGAGAELNAGGNVNINNSKFTRNKTAGAIIRAGGNVAIANSEFSNPTTARRQLTGLDIVSGGSVSLFNVLANTNRLAGATITAGGRVSIGSSVFSGNMSINSTFNGYGLQVVTPDAIDLANVHADNNFLWGADLDAGGDVSITDSTFNGNSTSSNTFIDDTGLLVTSGGQVSLNNVQANDNPLIGATIDAVGPVNINNSTFTNNQGVTTTAGVSTFYGLGLNVVSLNNIFLNGVTASGNNLIGAYLDAGGVVVVTNSTFSNNDTGSAADALGTGLTVISAGNTSLANVTLDNNQVYGASIDAGGNVFLDMITATGNGTNGVQVLNATCTQVTNGTYSGNGEYGLFLTNSGLSVIGVPTFANNGLGDIFPANPAPCIITLSTGGGTSGSTTTNNNTGSSLGASPTSLLQAVSYGAVTQRSTTGTPLFGATLNSVWFGANTMASGGVLSNIFSGIYTFVYSTSGGASSIDGMQIIAVAPVPPRKIAMIGD